VRVEALNGQEEVVGVLVLLQPQRGFLEHPRREAAGFALAAVNVHQQLLDKAQRLVVAVVGAVAKVTQRSTPAAPLTRPTAPASGAGCSRQKPTANVQPQPHLGCISGRCTPARRDTGHYACPQFPA
jgi:hypothetical protein